MIWRASACLRACNTGFRNYSTSRMPALRSALRSVVKRKAWWTWRTSCPYCGCERRDCTASTPERMTIPANARRQVIPRANDRSEYCGLSQAGQEALFHVDHVVPLTAGGTTTLDNLALARERSSTIAWFTSFLGDTSQAMVGPLLRSMLPGLWRCRRPTAARRAVRGQGSRSSWLRQDRVPFSLWHAAQEVWRLGARSLVRP